MNIVNSTGFGTSLCASDHPPPFPHLLFSLRGVKFPRVQYLLQNKAAPMGTGIDYRRNPMRNLPDKDGEIPSGAFQSLSADDYVLANSNFISTLDKLLSNNNTEKADEFEETHKSGMSEELLNGLCGKPLCKISNEREPIDKPHCFRYGVIYNQGAEIDLSIVDGKHNRTGRRQERSSVIPIKRESELYVGSNPTHPIHPIAQRLELHNSMIFMVVVDGSSILSRGIAGIPTPCMCGESFLFNTHLPKL